MRRKQPKFTGFAVPTPPEHPPVPPAAEGDTPLGCPWCGEPPVITKHFKHEMWSLLHRCRIIGTISIDWTTDRLQLLGNWNHRSVLVVGENNGIKPWVPKQKGPEEF